MGSRYRVGRLSPGIRVGIMAILCIIGCGDAGVFTHSSMNRFFFFYGSSPGDDPVSLPVITQEKQVIDLQPMTVTRFRFPPASVASIGAMAQELEIDWNHRLSGIRFPLRSLSGPGTIKAVLMGRGNARANFENPELIHLPHSAWSTVMLTFSDFTDTRSRLGRDVDRFHPGDWDTIVLLLIPIEDTGSDQVFEWGPADAVLQNHRYRFH
ncbi:hypothetical protein JXA80_04755 [bacterium]|nr:hypothetical protein [candidate division CSSED10-310 bacterium]